jgi:hypothetical protein
VKRWYIGGWLQLLFSPKIALIEKVAIASQSKPLNGNDDEGYFDNLLPLAIIVTLLG